MMFVPCQQGTPEWFDMRAGVCTASMFSSAVSRLGRKSGDKKEGDFSAASDKYAADLAIELISGKPYGEPPKAWTLQRGHDLEPLARQSYEMQTGNIALEAGICLTDDRAFGYSTDGLVGVTTAGGEIIGCEGLIEIKCPVDSTKILAMWQTGDVSEYAHQMQGGMWITGAKWCDFIMHVPDLENAGKDTYIKRVHRDDEFIEKLEADLLAFIQRVRGIGAFFRQPSLAEVLQAAAPQAVAQALAEPA